MNLTWSGTPEDMFSRDKRPYILLGNVDNIVDDWMMDKIQTSVPGNSNC